LITETGEECQKKCIRNEDDVGQNIATGGPVARSQGDKKMLSQYSQKAGQR